MPATPSHAELFAELAELIAIPSISADPEHASDLVRAADWVAERIRRAGGTVEIEQRNGRPLVIGEVAATGGAEAPTVLVYAHLDVQPADPLELWTSDPWQLDRARWASLRSRDRRRQGPSLHGAQGDGAPRRGRRAARERPLRASTPRKRSAGIRWSSGWKRTNAARTSLSSSTAATRRPSCRPSATRFAVSSTST